ncbi:hypothetical protein AB9X29_003757 [Vibrio vulnificus]
MKPTFDAVISSVINNETQKRFYTNVGKAWENKAGLINVQLFPGISVPEFALYVAEDQQPIMTNDDRLKVYVVEKNDSGEYWHAVGTAFRFEKGYSVKLDSGICISGHIVIKKAKNKKSDN